MSSSSVKASGHTLEVLEHGVRLITAPLGERNSVSLAAMFRVGSRYEPLELAGASHFIEHMLFKGSEGYPSAKAVAEAIEGVGGLLNAATDKELTMYWAKVSHDKLPLAVDVLCDILQRPLLDPAELDKEREVIIEELRMYQDSPGDHVHSVFEQMLWENHPLGVDVAGTEASLRAMTVGRLRAHLESHYLAPGLVLAVAGHVDHGQVIELLAPRIGWREAPLPAFVPSSPPPAEPRVRIVRRDTEQANIVFGTHCVSYNHPDRFTIDLMNTVLGEGMSSRLFLEVRERQGLCYDVHSWAGKLADTGSAGVYIGTDPGRAPAAVRGTGRRRGAEQGARVLQGTPPASPRGHQLPGDLARRAAAADRPHPGGRGHRRRDRGGHRQGRVADRAPDVRGAGVADGGGGTTGRGGPVVGAAAVELTTARPLQSGVES
jgi:predicted Zn-dependent peptidase